MRASNIAFASIGWLGLLAACGSATKDMEVEPPVPAEIAVVVTSPAPGAELLAGTHRSIVVSGTVTTSDPAQGELEAWVNGVRVDVVAGAFMTELTPEPGVNHIKVEGGNGTGELVGQELDVMWAPEYLPPLPDQTGFELPGALELRLGQRFFDARWLGTTLDRSTNPVVARDVASALELVLWHLDLASLIPGDIGTGPLVIRLLSVRPSNILVDARIVGGAQPAIELNVDLLGVFLAMDGSVTLGGSVYNIDGGITADLHASARLTLGTAEDGSIDVSVTNPTATVGSLVPGFVGNDGEELNALLAALGSSFRGLVEGLLSTDLIPTFTAGLPPLLETLLGTADKLLDDIQFTLDPGLGSPVTLKLDGHIGALDIGAGATDGHLTVRQDLTVRTSGAPIHPASRGAPRLDPLSSGSVLNTAGVHLTMRQDFLNALLHALWNAGMLEGQLMIGGLSATVSARLPPVVRPTPASSPCKIDGERCDVLVQLGQLEIQLPSFGQSFGVSASAGARIEVNGGTVSLAIQKVPDLRVWQTSPVSGALTADSVRDLIATVIWPQLFGAIGDKLTIALPLPDLTALGLDDLPPALAEAQLMLQMRQRPRVTGDELVLGADLVLATSPPPPP